VRRIGKKGSKRRPSFHHFYPKPYRNINHDSEAGTYLERDFHEWLHRNYSNYELAHEYFSRRRIERLRELYEMNPQKIA